MPPDPPPITVNCPFAFNAIVVPSYLTTPLTPVPACGHSAASVGASDLATTAPFDSRLSGLTMPSIAWSVAPVFTTKLDVSTVPPPPIVPVVPPEPPQSDEPISLSDVIVHSLYVYGIISVNSPFNWLVLKSKLQALTITTSDFNVVLSQKGDTFESMLTFAVYTFFLISFCVYKIVLNRYCSWLTVLAPIIISSS